MPPTPAAAPAAKSGRDAYVAAMAARTPPPSVAEDLADASTPAPDPVADPQADPPEADAAATETPAADVAGDAPPPEKPPAVDAVTAARLAAAQKADRARKDARTSELAAERAAIKAEREKADREIAEQRAEIEKGRAELAAFAKLKERVKYEPDAVLAELGLADEDFEHAARATWARSPAGKADPTQRETVARTQREREISDRIAAADERAKKAEERAASIEKRIEERDQAVKREEAAKAYIDEAAKVATTSTEAPLVARWLGKSPAKAREAMGMAAMDLLERDGVVPGHAEVVAELEARERARLEDLGYDVAVLLAPAAAPKPAGAPPPKVLPRTGGGPTQPPRKLTPEEQRAEFIRKRQAGRLDA